MAGVNKVILVGNLGDDPEVRSLNNGGEVVNLRVATSENWKDRDGNRQERTEWHRVVIFNENLGRVAKSYLRKGSKVYLEGQLQTRKWQGQDGQDRYSTEVVLQRFRGELVLLDSKGGGGGGYGDSGSSGDYGGDYGGGGGQRQQPMGRPQPAFDADLDDDVVPLRGLDHEPALADVVAGRLLDVDVLAGVGGEDRPRGVPVVGRGDPHGLDLLIVEHLSQVLDRPRRLAGLLDRLRRVRQPVGIHLAHVADLDILASGQQPEVVRTHPAATDQGDRQAVGRG